MSNLLRPLCRCREDNFFYTISNVPEDPELGPTSNLLSCGQSVSKNCYKIWYARCKVEPVCPQMSRKALKEALRFIPIIIEGFSEQKWWFFKIRFWDLLRSQESLLTTLAIFSTGIWCAQCFWWPFHRPQYFMFDVSSMEQQDLVNNSMETHISRNLPKTGSLNFAKTY